MAVPLFGDFQKRTKDFYDSKKYNFGKTLEIKGKIEDADLTLTLTDEDKPVGHSVKALIKRSWGSVEVVEHHKEKISAEFKLPKFYGDYNFKTKLSTDNIDATLDYQPEKRFYNMKLNGTTENIKASFAVGDDSLNLNVGGEVIFKLEEQKTADTQSSFMNLMTIFQEYQLGYLYTPTPDSSYSLIFKSKKKSNMLDYDLTLFRKLSDVLSISAKATGQVNTKLLNPPIFSLAGGYKNGPHYLQSFMNTNKEYGASYNIFINNGLYVNFGLSSLLDKTKQLNTRIGCKITISDQ